MLLDPLKGIITWHTRHSSLPYQTTVGQCTRHAFRWILMTRSRGESSSVRWPDVPCIGICPTTVLYRLTDIYICMLIWVRKRTHVSAKRHLSTRTHSLRSHVSSPLPHAVCAFKLRRQVKDDKKREYKRSVSDVSKLTLKSSSCSCKITLYVS